MKRYIITVEEGMPSQKTVARQMVDTMIKDMFDLNDCDMAAMFGEVKQDCRCSKKYKPNMFVPMGEPDGIDIHVDRPLPHMFEYDFQFRNAMAVYRELERLAHEADWPCREPMRGNW